MKIDYEKLNIAIANFKVVLKDYRDFENNKVLIDEFKQNNPILEKGDIVEFLEDTNEHKKGDIKIVSWYDDNLDHCPIVNEEYVWDIYNKLRFICNINDLDKIKRIYEKY